MNIASRLNNKWTYIQVTLCITLLQILLLKLHLSNYWLFFFFFFWSWMLITVQ